MPARRPYASRGVPRRATTRRSGRQPRRAAPFLIGALVFVLVGSVWALNPFASGAHSVPPAGDADPVTTPAAGTSVGAELADAPLAPAAPTLDEPTTRTLAPTLRQWDTNAAGIIDDPVLANRLDQTLSGLDGHVGVVVKDLGSGRGAVLNGALELQSASLYKLPVLYTVFDLGVNMSEELTITDEALSYDTGTMELAPGETLTVAEALERMVTLSDNTSAILLGSRVGAGHIDASIDALGMETTHYSLERMTTSALDIAHFMELVAEGKAVSPGASADMLHLMLRQRVNDRLPRLVPDSVQVAHKTGNLPGVVNDAGILYGPTSTIVVAALVSDTSDETAAATAIARVGLIAESYFGDSAESSPRPTILPAPGRAIPPVFRESHPPTPTPSPTPVATNAVLVQPTSTSVPPTALPTGAATAASAVIAATPQPTAKPTLAPPTPTHTPVPPPSATPVLPTPTPTPKAVVHATNTAAPTAVGRH